MKCEHDKEKTRCRECNGPGEGSFCLHGIIRGTCSSCEPEKAFLRCQRQAQERGIPFMLTEAQFRETVIKPCQYCNDYGSPRGIDRVDNFHGYIPGNVTACCPRCNRWKSNESADLFLGHVRRIQQHQEKLRLKSEIDRGGSAGVATPRTPVECISDNL